MHLLLQSSALDFEVQPIKHRFIVEQSIRFLKVKSMPRFLLGMNKLKAIRHVIMPQMLRLSIPGWSNEFTILLKDTSLAFGIGVIELMRQGRYIQVRDPDLVLLVFLLIALMFFCTRICRK